jgi:SAM-dependent methyltransferase
MNFWQNKKEKIYISLYDDMAVDLKTNEELVFYKETFTKKQSIIEFGCGTGRTLIPLLKGGFRISGLDFSAGMISQLKQKLKNNNLEAAIYQKDLTKILIKEKFDGGILSQRTLNFISTQEGQRKALENIHKALKRGAVLIINLMPARPQGFANNQKTFVKTDSFKNSRTGNIVESWEKWQKHPMEQTLEDVQEFREKDKKARTKMTMRILFVPELKLLLELCGFKVVGIYGDWKGATYDMKSRDLIVVAKKV